MIDGFRIGHHTADGDGWLTGTTVVLAGDGAVGGVDVRGGGPGTRETDLLDPRNVVERVNAVVLTGGSAYGLAAADGVMAALERDGIGFPVGPGTRPGRADRAGRGDLRPGSWRDVRAPPDGGVRSPSVRRRLGRAPRVRAASAPGPERVRRSQGRLRLRRARARRRHLGRRGRRGERHRVSGRPDHRPAVGGPRAAASRPRPRPNAPRWPRRTQRPRPPWPPPSAC